MDRRNGGRMVSPQDILPKMTIKELKALASKHGINVSHCRLKKEYLETISSHERIEKILEEETLTREGKDLERMEEELEAVGKEVRQIVEEVRKIPGIEDEEIDPLVSSGKSIDVDFEKMEDLLDQTRMRFEERNFEKAMSLSEEAIEYAHSSLEEFIKSVWAYAILSSQSLVEDCGKAGRDVEKAVNLLRKAKKAYKEGTFSQNRDLMRELQSHVRNLYSAEIEKAREDLYNKYEYVSSIANLGANVSSAEEMISKAREALKRNDYLGCVELSSQAKKLADEAKEKRIKEIEEAIPSSETIIEEARHVGADVGEALKLLKQAKIALRNKDYILAGELSKRAERNAMQSQHFQIEKAMELRKRQVEKAQGLIALIEPTIEEAESYGIDVSEARTLLAQAKDVLEQGDYVNGTVFARNAEEVAKRLEPKLTEERRKRGIEKPTEGICGVCKSFDLEFYDSGWGKCLSCGRTFRWKRAEEKSLWQKLKELLWE